jgi:hypothetical protein
MEAKGSSETYLLEIDTEIHGDKVKAVWKYTLEEREAELKEKEDNALVEPEYCFVLDVEGEERKSSVLKFTYPLGTYIEDESGKPLEDFDYTITLSVGTKNQGEFRGARARPCKDRWGALWKIYN